METKQCQFNLITILLVCVSFLSVSCGGGSGTGGGTGPGETASITLSVSTNSIPANGASSLSITATLSDNTGAAVDRGTSVEFTTTLGTFINDSETYTTSTPSESGTVTVSLIAAETEGTARITVKSNNVTQTYDVEFTVQVVGFVTVISGNPQLLADGISQTEITATVKDTDNHNMPDGTTTVYFSTDLGTLSADSATITNGQATVTLTSSTQAGTATITVVAASLSVSTDVTFVPGDVGIISLTATPNNLTADGHSTSTITATVTDANGNLVADGKPISFSVIAGTGTLSNNTGTTNMQTVSASTINGVATVTYTASFTALPEIVRAQAANGTTDEVDIVLIGQTIGSVTIKAGSSELVADGLSTTTISATVKDLGGVNVGDGTNVSFTTTAGTLLASVIPTSNGVATAILRSATNLGFAEVRATAGGVNATVRVDFVPGAPYRLTVLAVPQTVTVNGTSSIEAVVYDQYNNPAADGETLTFSANFGTLNALTATTSGGTASVTYRAPSSVPATINDTVRVETTNGRIGTVSITVTEPAVSNITLTANPTSIPADDESQATITATVTVTGGGDAPDGTIVTFSITSGGGSITPSATTTNGTTTAVLTSGTVTGTATIRAEAEGVSATVEVEYVPTPASISLGLSQATVKSDNSDSSTITATVLDSNFAVIEGIMVTFISDGGQLSAPTADTDENGEASVNFSSGTTDRSNRVIIVTAMVSGLALDAQIPIQVTGTTLTLTTDATNLEIGGNDQATLTITARDAGDLPIYNAQITITSSPSGVVQISNPIPTNGRTDVTGQLKVTVTALSAGDVTVQAAGLGATGTKGYTVGSVGNVFTITDPTDDPHSASTSDTVTVTVNAPTQTSVQFATTLGEWDFTGQVINVLVAGGVASADLRADEAGTANIMASDVDDPYTSDSLTILFSAPSSEADNISLQASATVVAPSTGGVSNSVNLTATVKNADGQVVGGAAVAFSIEDPTGGGEFVTPPVAFTDSFGIAEATFTSGSLSSDSEGVTVRAVVVDDPTIADTIQIIIGGTGGSLVIGQSTTISSINNDTAYSLPMSVLVSDSNGNPVSGAVVTLNLWPLQYGTGCWVKVGEEFVPGNCPAPTYTFYDNEDDNHPDTSYYRNLILDDDPLVAWPAEPSEDGGSTPIYPGHGNGQLTPPLSAAGAVPGTVTTGANGVGDFELVFLKSSAAWIRVEVTASAVVSGTENQVSQVFILPWMQGEGDNLPDSPYNP